MWKKVVLPNLGAPCRAGENTCSCQGWGLEARLCLSSSPTPTHTLKPPDSWKQSVGKRGD